MFINAVKLYIGRYLSAYFFVFNYRLILCQPKAITSQLVCSLCVEPLALKFYTGHDTS